MSYSYSTEPPTNGKVVIKTSGGDLEVELWGKETPKAVRNFLQLAMDKEYDNALFYSRTNSSSKWRKYNFWKSCG